MKPARAAPGAAAPRHDAARDRRAGGERLTRRAILSAGAVALLAAAIYLPRLRTGFASEDFLILAQLWNQDLLTTARNELTSPWLGLESVGFWRPVSTLLLALELRLLGPDPGRLHGLHLLAHALNALLVALIVARVARPRGAAGAAAVTAALFAIHPFHPSAVLFTGAFATLHGATFSLIAMLCFLTAASDRGRRRGLELAALISFALALGCYEASAVVPVALLSTVLLFPDLRRAVPRLVPFFAVLAVWFVARLLILGTPVGGYGDFRARFLGEPLERAVDLARSVRVLFHPAFDPATGLPPGLVAAALGALAIGGLLAAISSAAWRTALAGLTWVAIFLAPFAFIGLVPATGRYAYLAVAGALLVLAGLDNALTSRWARVGSLVASLALAVVAGDWLGLLHDYLVAADEASAQVSAVRGEVLRVAAELPPDTLLLVEGHPDFVKGAGGVPFAKVFQYGLAESIERPFGPFEPLERTVVPMPAGVAPEARAALAAFPGAARYRWNEASRQLSRVEPSPSPPPPSPRVDLLAIDLEAGVLDVGCEACDASRLVVLTSVMPFASGPMSTAGGTARFAVPAAFLRGVARHRERTAFFWIEERAAGRPVALSPIARFTLARDPVRAFVEAAAKIRRDRDG